MENILDEILLMPDPNKFSLTTQNCEFSKSLVSLIAHASIVDQTSPEQLENRKR
jgi:hypothetical protein